MTREEVKKKYLIKPRGETIECLIPKNIRVYISQNGFIYIAETNEFGDMIVLNKETLKKILQQVL